MKIFILLFFTTFSVAAPPEITLTVHRIIDKEQNLNETLVVHATHDLIILEASDVQRNNETADNSTDFDEHPHNSNVKERISVPLSRPTRETNVTHDGNGHVLVQLPSKDNITTDVVVGHGTHVVNQVSGELTVESKGGWHVRIRTFTKTGWKEKRKSTDFVKEIIMSHRK